MSAQAVTFVAAAVSRDRADLRKPESTEVQRKDQREKEKTVASEREELNVERLRAAVRATYERVAAIPDADFDFHRGADYAVRRLNYSADDLARVPRNSLMRFSGAGNPHRIGPLRSGEIVLDHACGAGTDLIIAAHRVGPTGRVIGVDMTPGMLDHAWRAAVTAGVDGWTSLFDGVYEDLPVDDASVDVVISNGVLNLAPDKARVLDEVFRVLRPGGRLYLADVVLQRPLRNDLCDTALWTACIGGALTEAELLARAADAGFVKGQITERFDCFRETPNERKVPREVGAGAVNFYARKPGL